ncbi:Glutamate--tRNA ligase mitochondrial [Salix suchowensis]|nr:Glutamate--tRNA ligase mitochondrial [Salix suchowensis]
MALLRFAPSPTGALHLGGLRTALYNYLYAKKHGGKWIMRIEDTDASLLQTRYVPGSVDNIRKALEWAGLEYDYDRLTTTREKLARSGSNETYDKHCLYLSDEEVARKVRAGEKSVVRLNDDKLPTRPPSVDIVFGKLRDSHLSLPTDPILLKSDLFPTYHLASVVDDHEMGITHVLRGEFAHIPILVNADGSKMSKRNGDVQVADYIVGSTVIYHELAESTTAAARGRLTNVQDIGLHTPYLFIEPDYSSEEAQAMIKNIPEESCRSYDPLITVYNRTQRE